MKKHIQSIIEQLKYIYPNEQIAVINGFIGVINGERLKHTSYLGNAYYQIENVIYEENNGKSKKLITL